MKKFAAFFLLAFVVTSSGVFAADKTAKSKPTASPTAAPAATPAPKPSPEEVDVSARSKALELAGAFSNDGYKIRDGFWPGEIEVGRPQLIEVNLFAGNEYWFSGAAAPPGRKFAVSVFDEKGKPMSYQVYEDGPVAAAGFVPQASGKYIVKVALVDGEKTDFCLLYSYK
jgi:hypothetical protein